MRKNRPEPKFLELPYPSAPYETLYKKYSALRGLHSKHTADLRWLAILITGFAAALLILSAQGLLFDTQNVFGQAELISALIAAWFAALVGIYQLGKKRFSTVDIFGSEIITIARIIAVNSMIGNYTKFFNVVSEEEAHPTHRDLASEVEGVRTGAEDFMENFHRRSEDIGLLRAEVVDYVTNFYTLLKATRDRARVLHNYLATEDPHPDEINKAIINIVYLIDLLMFNAYLALSLMIEGPANKKFAKHISLYLCCEANNFLLEHMDRDDNRFAVVKTRNVTYQDYIRKLGVPS